MGCCIGHWIGRLAVGVKCVVRGKWNKLDNWKLYRLCCDWSFIHGITLFAQSGGVCPSRELDSETGGVSAAGFQPSLHEVEQERRGARDDTFRRRRDEQVLSCIFVNTKYFLF